MNYMGVKYELGYNYRSEPGPQVVIHLEGNRCGGIVDGPHYFPVDNVIIDNISWVLGSVWPCQICCKHLWTSYLREQLRQWNSDRAAS